VKSAALAAALAVLACAPAAFARDGGGEEAPDFASLPSGHVSDVPSAKDRPARIGAAEKVPGFYTMSVPKVQAGYHYAYLVGDAQELEALQALQKRKGGPKPRPSPSTTCFVDGERSRAMREKEAGPWEAGGAERLTLHVSNDGQRSRKKDPLDTHGVYAIHAERFVAGDGGKASLEMTDAWVDALTLGARLVGRSTLPLVHVASGPSGIEIYAARDKDRVEVVVTPAKPPLPQGEALARASTMFANGGLSATLSDNRGFSSSCGHMRVSLHLERGAADMAVVQATALLPPLDKEAASDGEGEQAAGVKQAIALPEEMRKLKEEAKAFQALRRRPVSISVSASELSVDPQPVLSVAMGWSGKEERSF
jgi:hypothetical protein